jgi:hypothetical protein
MESRMQKKRENWKESSVDGRDEWESKDVRDC